MAKYRKRVPLVDAVPWFKLGDHPEVVAYPNPEDVIEDVCPKCGESVSAHGWIKSPVQRSVCPGDFVVEDHQGDRFAMKPAVFREAYELLPQDTPEEKPVVESTPEDPDDKVLMSSGKAKPDPEALPLDQQTG